MHKLYMLGIMITGLLLMSYIMKIKCAELVVNKCTINQCCIERQYNIDVVMS